jgi:hypothetical protein
VSNFYEKVLKSHPLLNLHAANTIIRHAAMIIAQFDSGISGPIGYWTHKGPAGPDIVPFW